MLVFRYLAKEVFIALTALTVILLFIFMSNQFVNYLHRVANGQIPIMIILKLMLLELPNLLALLLPLGFYIALLVGYGRLYADSEMIVLQACGYGPNQLLKHSLLLAVVVMFLVGVMMIYLSPYVATERAKLLRETGVKTFIQTLMPGHFQLIADKKQVVYVESMSANHQQAQHVFLAQQMDAARPMLWRTIWSDQAYLVHDIKKNQDHVVLHDGRVYEGMPGQADYQIAEFMKLTARLPQPNISVGDDIRVLHTAALLPFFNTDIRKLAELQWRLSIPIMVLILTCIAVPLSRVNPRKGKLAHLLPAIMIYFLYANGLFIARNSLVAGKIPAWLGLWWLHIVFGLLAVSLIWIRRHELV